MRSGSAEKIHSLDDLDPLVTPIMVVLYFFSRGQARMVGRKTEQGGMGKMRCPGFKMITDWVDGRMKDKEKENQIELHMQTCNSCAGTADWARQIISAMASRDLVDAPEYVLHRAISMFPQKKRILPRLIQAVLRFDSWAEPMAAGVRSGDRAPRQLMYQTQDYNVFLMFLPAQDQRAVVLGQLVANNRKSDASGFVVELKERSRVLSHVKTSASGEFYLKSGTRKQFPGPNDVPRKRVDLLIYKDKNSILLSDITGPHN